MIFLDTILDHSTVNYGRDLRAPIDGAPNFKYGEFVASNSAFRNSIHNIPTEEQWQNIEYLARNILQPIRQQLGIPIRLSSGYRCPALNSAIGGSPRSHHSHGRACDIVPVGRAGNQVLLDLLNMAVFGGLPVWEVIMEDYPTGWLHVAHFNGQTRSPEDTIKIMVKRHNRHQMPIFNDPNGEIYLDVRNDPIANQVAKALGVAIRANYEEITSFMAGDLRALDNALVRHYYKLQGA